MADTTPVADLRYSAACRSAARCFTSSPVQGAGLIILTLIPEISLHNICLSKNARLHYSEARLMKTISTIAEGPREKLLASAEGLFAKLGFNGVSVRDIANAAGVNSALVGYYFGGKQGLLAEVYNRHAKPLTMERLRLLDEFRRSTHGLTLETVLEAFIRPSLEVTTDEQGHSNFTRLRAILSGENSALLEKLVAKNFDNSIRTFTDEISAFVPHLLRDEVFWRFHFLIGAIYYTGTGPHRIHALTKGICDPSDPIATSDQLIPFVVAGFLAPGRSSQPGPAKRKTSRKAATNGKKPTATTSA